MHEKQNIGTQPIPSLKKVIIEEIISWSKIIAFTVFTAIMLNQFVIVNATVPTGSMENVIMSNDRIVAFRLSYLFNPPERYHIVIFRYPDDESQLYVKRIIGLPGETVNIRGGLVFIGDSDTPLRDDFIINHIAGDYGPFYVPDNSYFMLGDNRANSEDSRSWINPFVYRGNILGRAVFKYYRGLGFLR